MSDHPLEQRRKQVVIPASPSLDRPLPTRDLPIIDVEFTINEDEPLEQQLRNAGYVGLSEDDIYLIRRHLGLE